MEIKCYLHHQNLLKPINGHTVKNIVIYLSFTIRLFNLCLDNNFLLLVFVKWDTNTKTFQLAMVT